MEIQTPDLPTWGDAGIAGLKLLIVAVLVLIGTIKVVNVITSFRDFREMRENTAYNLARAGLTFAGVVAMLSLINYKSANTGNDLLWLVLGAAAGLGTLLLTRAAVSKAVPFKRNPDGSRQSRTLSVGIMRAAVFLAVGLLLNGAFGVSADTNLDAVLWMMASFGQSLLVMVLVFWVISHKFELMAHIRNGCNAAAVIAGSIMVGLAWALKGGMMVNFSGWVFNESLLALYTIMSLSAFALTLWAVDKFAYRQVTMREVIDNDEWRPAVTMATLILALGGAIGSVAV